MNYTNQLHPRVRWQIQRWGLSDFLLVEVYLALAELATNPVENLYRDPGGARGALYVFRRTDSDDERFRHLFQFRVFYDEDEKTLHIVRASYWRYLV